mgnify:CR=1 FL=1
MTLNGMSPRQIRAARMLLGWSQSDLARHADVSITVIARVETASVDARLSTILAIHRAFEEHGIEFVEEGGGVAGGIHYPQTRAASARRRSDRLGA